MNCSKCGKALEPGSSFCTACGSPQNSVLQITVGRDPANDIVVSNERVSRHQAVITQSAQGFALSDQSSANGTFVNGVRTSTGALKPGDQIMLGNHVLLDWNQIESAFQKKGNPAYQRPAGQGGFPKQESEPYNPVFIQEAPLLRKHSRVWLYVVLGVVSAAILFGIWYFLLRNNGDTYDKVNVTSTYTYKMKLGEDRDMSLTRSRLETLEALLKQAADSLDTQNSLLANYCLLDTKIHDDPMIKEPADYMFKGTGEIVSSGTTSVEEKDYLAREEYLHSKPEHVGRIKVAEETLAKAKQELKLAEAALVAWAQGEDGVRFIRRSFGLEEVEGGSEPSDSVSTQQRSLDFSAFPRENYEKALKAYEEVFTSLDSLRKELLEINAKNKRQKMKASNSGKS